MNINKVTITVEMGNEDCQNGYDLARILQKLAHRINTYGLEKITKVMDENGNNVGKVEVE